MSNKDIKEALEQLQLACMSRDNLSLYKIGISRKSLFANIRSMILEVMEISDPDHSNPKFIFIQSNKQQEYLTKFDKFFGEQ